MINILMSLQIILAIFLILSIMIQDTKSNISTNTENNQSYFKPKGKEAFLGKATRILAICIFVNTIAILVM